MDMLVGSLIDFHCCDNNANNPDADDPMLLLIDKSDCPSIVEQ